MDSAMARLKPFAKMLIRKRHPFIMGDMSRTEPVSKIFGMERGMPIDRYYIEKFIGDCNGMIRGDALEVGDLRYL